MSDVVTLWVPDSPGGRLYMTTPFALKEAVKALPGARWDPEHKAWHIPATSSAAKAAYEVLAGWTLSLSDDAANLLREAAEQEAAQDHKVADEADLPDLPTKLPAWLHQKRAFAFARARRGAMLAMDMGTGKSMTAIALLEDWKSDVAVILCPRSVMGVWPNQFATHAGREWRVIVPPGNATVAKRAIHVARQLKVAEASGQPAAVICNYEASWRPTMKELLRGVCGMKGTVLVLDESHRVKSAGGKASMNCAVLGREAERVLLLTGTPMPHSPLDLYGQYRAMDPGIFGTSNNRFRNRYAIMGGFEGRQVVGYQNEAELARKFGAAAFVVKKDEAGLDLPPVVHEERTFELGPKSLKAYVTLDNDFVLGVGDGTVTTQNALVKLLRLQQVTSGYVRDDDGVDHQVGEEKIDVLKDLLEDVPKDEPLVIFARFQHDIQSIAAVCSADGRRVGIVDGNTKPHHDHYGLNEHSQMRSDIDVCILQIQSGGVGIDLTRAALAVYYSLDFSLGNYEQSLARLDRPGQTRSVTYFHLIAQGTKDEVVYKALRERKNVVEAVIEASRPDNNKEA
jgi:SNF2 family DNA or RNA helicase